MEKFLEYLKKSFNIAWPYLVLFLATLAGTYLVFYQGVVMGHDYAFHVPNVIEEYETLKQTGSLSPISGILGMGLGHGTRLFYAPLSHLIVTLTTFIIEPMGGSILDSFKVVLVISVFLSGIFMYRFAMHFTHDNKLASIIAASMFVLFPYRIMDVFTRFAWAEALAFTWLPLFFMGLYDICHVKNDEPMAIKFLEVVLGGSLLFLTHNLTAFWAYLAGVIFLLFNIKFLVKQIKEYKYWIHCMFSVGLLISIASITLFSELELMNTNIYTVSIPERMWADYASVAKRTTEVWIFSGFLNIKSITYWFGDMFTRDSIIMGNILFILGVGVAIATDKLLKRFKYSQYYSLPLGIGLMFAIISIYGRRIEIYLSAMVVAIILIFIKFYQYNKDKTICQDKDVLYKNPLFYYTMTMIIVLFILMSCKWPWAILPELFLKIQFPWRLWALVQIMVSILVGLLIHYIHYKNIMAYVMCGLTGFMLVSNNALADRRGCFELKYNEHWVSETDYNTLKHYFSIGACREYVPYCLLDDDYHSEYINSLWHDVRNMIRYSFEDKDYYEFTPVVLKGSATIEVKKHFSPEYELNINVAKDDTLVQMPLLYYPGYEIIVSNDNETRTLIGENVDGFVSFNLNKGNYQVSTKFVGSTTRQVSLGFTIGGSIIASGTLVYGLFFEKKVRNKIKEKRLKNKAISN